ncbi:MAG: DUF4153 domain-containing protein [Candidatus Kapabacteria bacterium]|jgi:hypothetical protein|nr:DUF4153 domain-containing protein [Candidatus Kapabacteria bacterium]
MKKISVQDLWNKAAGTLKRFPFVLAFALICTIADINLNEYDDDADWIKRLAFTSCLAVPLFTGLKFLSERKQFSITSNIIAHAVGILLLLLHYFFFEQTEADYIQFGMYMVAGVFFVSVAPYFQESSRIGFWQYNKILILQLLLSGFFTSVLYIGLSVAILGSDELLGIEWGYKIYFELWIALLGVFNTWLFLANTPSDFDIVDKTEKYEKLIKVFAQFVLIPIAGIYFIILYAYGAKIIVNWELPNGWVSGLVLGYAGVGLLARLLLYPIREQADKKWVNIVSKTFTISVFPLLLLASVGVYRRVLDYGITEPRYFLIILIAWLLFISLYFLFSKQEKIKLIPLSLLVVTLITSVGPWGAFSVSTNSQIDRFMRVYSDNEQRSDTLISNDLTANEINANLRSISFYLDEQGTLDELKERLIEEKPDLADKITESLSVSELMSVLDITKSKSNKEYYNSGRDELTYLGDNLYFIDMASRYPGQHNRTYKGENCSAGVIYQDEDFILNVDFTSERFGLSDIRFSVDMKNIFSEIRSKYGDNNSMPRYIKHVDHEAAIMTLILSNINGKTFEDSGTIQSLGGFETDILIRVK